MKMIKHNVPHHLPQIAKDEDGIKNNTDRSNDLSKPASVCGQRESDC